MIFLTSWQSGFFLGALAFLALECAIVCACGCFLLALTYRTPGGRRR